VGLVLELDVGRVLRSRPSCQCGDRRDQGAKKKERRKKKRKKKPGAKRSLQRRVASPKAEQKINGG
jgi:hypothetical protein